MNKYLIHLDTGLRAIDIALAAGASRFLHNPPSLEALLFHPVFNSHIEAEKQMVSPFEKFTLSNFRVLIEFYLEQAYQFISPIDLDKGLEPSGKYVWLTFDDGYANNMHIVPLLKEYSISATFFIATNHVLQNRPFWWDVVMHYRGKQGIPRLKTLRERNYLKTLQHCEIEAYLLQEFGPGASHPTKEHDRPMTPDELRDFSKEKWVHLGNHTHDHAILTNYDRPAIAAQIRQCQQALKEMTGITATAISYPDGGVSELVVEVAKEEGLNIGVTTEPIRNIPPPKTANELMKIGRSSLSGDFNIQQQCRGLRVHFSPLQKLRGIALNRYQAMQPKLNTL